ncbi:phosphodiester glycosidase family protein [Acrocarpospora catenulata]|uniref:phosphodiester glycosidase family protein n=1 Tax=Acrocarpospora catenulata TaxID=2836182 RepID=UPI0027E1BFC0|nr:phosphodiester glycosidase family protein [Acrocarpospora catenulata]
MSAPALSAVPATAESTPAESAGNSVLAAVRLKPSGLPTSNFPLGIPGIPKSAAKSLAAGVEYISVKHGTSEDGYTVSLLQNSNDAMSATTAQNLALAAQSAGFEPTVVQFTRPAVADFPAQDFWMVRIGNWTLKQKDQAAKVVAQLKQAGLSAKVDFLGDDGFLTSGPWSMRLLIIDPKTFRGSFASSLGTSTATREKVSAMAKADGAMAAINGGFFDIHTAAAYRGDPTGISVVDGKLLSEAVDGRTAVVMKGRSVRITELTSTMLATSGDGSTAPVGGVNRVPKANELVLYTEEFGAKTPATGGAEAVLDETGKVVGIRNAGGKVTKGKRVLHGVGAGADWLWAHAWEGKQIGIKTSVKDLRRGKSVPLTPDTYIVGGGVGLLKNGKTWITASTDGMANINMIVRRHPRTLVGVAKNGKVILAVLDGRAPGTTVGASFHEAARLMRWLGARDAINLDGGGSSAMVIGKKVVNKPSDGSERAVGDALLVRP